MKKVTKILLIALCVLAALALVALGIFLHMYGQMDTSALRRHSEITTPAPGDITGLYDSPAGSSQTLTEEERNLQDETARREQMQQDATEVISDDAVYNILLIGSDSRTGAIERSDAMILVSVNKNTKTIWLTSLLRDTQITIDNWGQAHLNWCTSISGPELLLDTIASEKNFAVKVDNWAMVNFMDFIEIAEMLGPVTVSVTPEEAQDINLAIEEVCKIRDENLGLSGASATPRCFFPPEGAENLTIYDGAQILGFCRERKVGGDVGRTAKQRLVVSQMLQNAKHLSVNELYTLAEKALGIVKTDLTQAKFLSLMVSAPSFLKYDIQGQQCPVAGSMYLGMDANATSIISADFRVNRNFLQATIYNKPMTQEDLTSTWTGVPVLVWWPEDSAAG